MRLVPLSYNVRSLWVRRSATLLTTLGLAATVAVVAGVLALEQGFETLFTEAGSDRVMVLLRPGATDEGTSVISRERAEILIKSRPEIAVDAEGRPLGSKEVYLGIRRRKVDGGETNVPLRGVEPMTFEIHGDAVRIVEGRRPARGADEVVVGRRLVGRIRDCGVGDVLVLNTTPFRVVGVLDHDGPYASEIWGDFERIGEALERPIVNRVLVRLRDDVDPDRFAEELKNDPRAPAKAMTERAYFASLTRTLSTVLGALAAALATIMGTAAVFTATNTMLAALAARTHEIGILRAVGFGPVAVFASFLFETVVLCLIGGALGVLLTLPLQGVETGTTNYQTFTEVAFSFRVTPKVLSTAIAFSALLGLLGGAWPAWKAARMQPVDALRRR